MAEFGNYSFKNASVIFGIIEMGGFADGDDVVNIEQNAEQFTKTVGAKGDVTRVQTADNSARVTVKLLQTSSTNKELTNTYLGDRETAAAAAPLIVTNLESGEVFACNNAWIVGYPTVTRGAGVNIMEWVFDCDYMTPALT